MFFIVLPAANPYILVDSSLHPCLLFSFLLQSKHKEDASATRPILLYEPEFEVCLLPFFLPFFFIFFFYLPFCIINSYAFLSSSFFLFFIFCFPGQA